MNEQTVKDVVLQFNEGINSRNLQRLAILITDDHTFIDSANQILSGKEKVLQSWKGFFESYPDYKNVFETIEVEGETVKIKGYSICSVKELDGPAIWKAKVRKNKIAEWRIIA